MNLTTKIEAFPQFFPVVVTFTMDALQTKIWPLQNKSSVTFPFNSTFSAHPGLVLKTEALIPICNVPDHPCQAMLHQRTLYVLSAEQTVTYLASNCAMPHKFFELHAIK
jgi:hypothetical protein